MPISPGLAIFVVTTTTDNRQTKLITPCACARGEKQLLCTNLKYVTVIDIFRIRKLLFRIETVVLPLESELDVAVVNLCAIFQTRYLQQCKEDIVSDKR